MRTHLAFLASLALLSAACEQDPGVTDATTTDVNDTEVTEDDAADGAVGDAEDATATAPPIGAYAQYCEQVAVAACAQLAKCCQASVGCVEGLRKVCLGTGKFKSFAEAAQAGKLTLDPALAKACEDGIAQVGEFCHKFDLADAMIRCMAAWTDPASLGTPCVTGGALEPICAGGQGRCIQVPTADPYVSEPVCTLAVGANTACGKDKPCQLGGVCTGLAVPTGEKTCHAYGEFCWVQGDIYFGCPGGLTCQDTTCVADDGAAAGQPCSVDDDCREAHDCTDGFCVPEVCGGF